MLLNRHNLILFPYSLLHSITQQLHQAKLPTTPVPLSTAIIFRTTLYWWHVSIIVVTTVIDSAPANCIQYLVTKVHPQYVCVFSLVSTLQFTACTFTRSALLMFHCLTFSRVPSDTLTGVGGVVPTHPHTFPRVGTCHMTPCHTPLEIVPRHPAPTGSAVAPLQGKIMLLGTFVELSWDNMNIVIDRTFSKIKKNKY